MDLFSPFNSNWTSLNHHSLYSDFLSLFQRKTLENETIYHPSSGPITQSKCLNLIILLPSFRRCKKSCKPSSKRIDHRQQNDYKSQRAANFPEISLGVIRINDIFEVHAKIRREEGEGQENDRDAREYQNGFILGVGGEGEVVLFDRAKLEQLYMAD